MADVSKTVEILFNGTDNVSGVLKDISGKTEDISGYFLTAAADILVLEAALGTLAVGGLVAAIVQATAFSESMAVINTLLDIGGEEFDKYSTEVLNYSTGSTQALENIQLALYNAISLGTEYTDSLGVISVGEKLAVASKADLNTAIETLVGTLNAYGLGAGDAARFSDIFFTIIKDGKTTLPELSTSIADVTGIASAAGIPFETLGAAIAAMTASGAPTAQAITKIKAAIESIINPTDSARAAAASFGIDLSAAALKSKGFEVVLKEIYDATEGDIGVMASMITSVEGLQGALILGADKSGIFAKALDDMAKSAGATETAFNKMKDNLNLVWQTMLNNFNTFIVRLGLEFEEEASDLIQAFSEIFKSMGIALDEGMFDEMIAFVKQKMAELTEIVNAAGDNLPEVFDNLDTSKLIDGLEKVFNALGVGFDAVDLTSVEGLTKAFQSVIDVLTILQESTAAIITALKPVFDLFGYMAGVTTDVSDEIKTLGDGLKTLAGLLLSVTEHIELLLAVMVVSQILAFATGVITLTYNLANLGRMMQSSLVAGQVIGFFTNIPILSATAATAVAALTTGIGYTSTAVVGLVASIGAFAGILTSFYSGWKIGELLTDSFPVIDKFTQSIYRAIDSVIDFTGQKGNIDLSPELEKTNKELTKTTENLGIVTKSIEGIPRETKTKITVNGETVELENIAAYLDLIDVNLENEKELKIGVDESSIKKATDTVKYFVDGEWHTIEIPIESNIEGLKKEIATIPTEKLLEIKLLGDFDVEIAHIKSQAETLQTAVEWSAKLNIADVEAGAAVTKQAFSSIGDSVVAVSESTASMFGSLLGGWDDLTTGDKWQFTDMIEDELDVQKKLADSQIELNSAQAEYMSSKAEALSRGDALITINSSGLEPSLQMIMWEILEKVQIRASKAGSELLLGL